MKTVKTLGVIGVVFLIALAFYIFSTPHGSEIPLTGTVDGNEVIVSPQITGRIINLTVDEGSPSEEGRSDRGAGSQGAASEPRGRERERGEPASRR